jgi:hypothetical protein
MAHAGKLLFAQNTNSPMKKTTSSSEKALLRLETAFFSSSMRLPVKKQFFAGD